MYAFHFSREFINFSSIVNMFRVLGIYYICTYIVCVSCLRQKLGFFALFHKAYLNPFLILTDIHFEIVLLICIFASMLTYRYICVIRIDRSRTVKYMCPSITTYDNKCIASVIKNISDCYTGYKTKTCDLLP